jgi:hypothetical protein
MKTGKLSAPKTENKTNCLFERVFCTQIFLAVRQFPQKILRSYTARSGQRGKDSQDSPKDRTKTRGPGGSSRTRTARKGQPRKNSQDRTARTGRAGQDSQDGRNYQERIARTGQPGQDNQGRTVRSGQDSQDRTSRIGLLGQDSQTGQLE